MSGSRKSVRGGRSYEELAEVLDRVLDRGIVIDATIRVDVAGLALASIDAQVVVACIETYIESAEALGCSSPTGWWSREALDDAPGSEGRGQKLPRHETPPLLEGPDSMRQ